MLPLIVLMRMDRNMPEADYIIDEYDKIVQNVGKITDGKMADVVMDSIGASTWDSTFASVGINGRGVVFGALTGAEVKLNVRSLYTRQIKLIGSTGGTRKELQQLIDLAGQAALKVRYGKNLNLMR